MKYDYKAVEAKWQKVWEDEKTFHVEIDHKKPKFYALVEFPYPSGAGLHVGHPRSYTALDVVSRKRRKNGYNVLYPMGWDAFGLPTENFAMKNHIHPAIVTKSNVDHFRSQLKALGFSFDWDREINTDILNQLPLIFKDYIHTDMDITTIAKLLASFLKIDSSNIILAQTPVFMGVPNVGKTDSFAGYSCVVPDAGSIANLLNQYFCTYTGPVEVSEMHMVTDQWPHGSASTDANVQYMGRIDKESDDAILSGDTDLSGAVTTDGQAAGTGQ